MNDDRLLEEALRALPPAPETPRERMWAGIGAARAAQAARGPATAARRRRDRWRWTGTGAALAAVLALGIVIGRGTDRAPGAGPVADHSFSTDARRSDGYRQAAQLLFDRAELRLADFQAGPADDEAVGSRIATANWAGGLLAQTRLLLDSPAADDADARRLLRELELVLAEIVALPDSGSAAEAARIADGLHDRGTVQRLRLARAL